MTRGVSEVPSKGRYAKVVSEDMGVLKLDTNVDYRDVGYDRRWVGHGSAHS